MQLIILTRWHYWSTNIRYAVSNGHLIAKTKRNEKKVLLRERPLCSNYTLCCSSWGYPPYPDLKPDINGGRVPQSWPGMGYPHPYLGWGSPHPDLGWGYTPIWTWDGDSPPPSPVEEWTDKQTENNTFPHPSDASGKNAKRVTKREQPSRVLKQYWTWWNVIVTVIYQHCDVLTLWYKW